MTSWQHPDRPVILASQSPRRKQILTQMGIAFRAESPDFVNESSFIDATKLDSSLVKLAKAKAMSVADKTRSAIVLGADTVVVKENRVVGKPADRQEAQAILSALSHSRHTVLTAVALLCRSCAFEATAIASTEVVFRSISDAEISAYLDIDEYRDKAGAYAIQGRAMIFIDSINGCYYNVVGLPVSQTIGVFQKYSEHAVRAHALKLCREEPHS